MAVTQEVVLNFLLEQGGKVKNSELIKRFKPVLDSPDPQEKATNRELFKRFVNNVAVVKDENEYKVVVLRKKYTHLLAVVGQSPNTQEEEAPQNKGEVQEEVQPVSDTTEEPSINSDSEKSSQQDLSEPQDHSLAELKDSGVGERLQESTDQKDLSNLEILVSVTEHENDDRRESVFDIISRMDHEGPVHVPKSWSDGQFKDLQKPHMLPLRYAQTSFEALEGEQDENTSVPLVDPLPVVQGSPPMSQAAPPTIHIAQPRSPHVSRRNLDDVGSKSPHMKRVSKTMKASEENKYSDVVPLIQHEHEWLVAATNGRWNHKLLGLMMIDSELADKRDFISGLTALHWAAKSGNTEMVKLLFDLSKKGGGGINVNVRSFGGYTPLHLAALHERKDVIIMLVRDYSANVHIRDNSGRKPYHYLKKGCAVPLRYILKDPAILNMDHANPIKRNSKVGASILGTTSAFLGVISDDLAFHDLTKGLKKPSSLNKFFTAPSGSKKKLKSRDHYPSVSSLCEEPEEAEEMVGKRRPVSEFFTH